MSSPRIVPRAEWQTEYNPTWQQWRDAGRRQPFVVPPKQRKGLVIHNNGPDVFYTTEHQERRVALNISAYHWRTLKWSDVAYSYMVGNVTGNVYEIRGLDWDQFANGDDQVGANDGDDTDWYTAMWIGGNYQPVSDAALEGYDMLIELLRSEGAGKRVLPHNDFRVKPCPGPTLTAYARERDNRDLETEMPVPFIENWNAYFNDQPRNGDPDFIVHDIERRLAALGYSVKVDGRKGTGTLEAIESFKVDQFEAENPNANLGARAWARLRELTTDDAAAPAPGPSLKDGIIESLAAKAKASLDEAAGFVEHIAATVTDPAEG